jgi:hypothetical protein
MTPGPHSSPNGPAGATLAAGEAVLRDRDGDGECPRICVGVSELESHAFHNNTEERASEGF